MKDPPQNLVMLFRREDINKLVVMHMIFFDVVTVEVAYQRRTQRVVHMVHDTS